MTGHHPNLLFGPLMCEAFIRCSRTWSPQGINWWMWIPGATGTGQRRFPVVVMDISWFMILSLYIMGCFGDGKWNKMRGIPWNRVIFCNKTKRVVIKLWLSIRDRGSTYMALAFLVRGSASIADVNRFLERKRSQILNDLCSFFVPKVVSE